MDFNEIYRIVINGYALSAYFFFMYKIRRYNQKLHFVPCFGSIESIKAAAIVVKIQHIIATHCHAYHRENSNTNLTGIFLTSCNEQ